MSKRKTDQSNDRFCHKLRLPDWLLWSFELSRTIANMCVIPLNDNSFTLTVNTNNTLPTEGSNWIRRQQICHNNKIGTFVQILDLTNLITRNTDCSTIGWHTYAAVTAHMAERLAWAFELGENKFSGYAHFSSRGGTVAPIACRRRTSVVDVTSVRRRTCQGAFWRWRLCGGPRFDQSRIRTNLGPRR